MKSITLPRTMSHIHRDEMIFCVLCQVTCTKSRPCWCHSPALAAA
jgi:hypothetical protein